MASRRCKNIRSEPWDSHRVGAKCTSGETTRALCARSGMATDLLQQNLRLARARQNPDKACLALLQLSCLPTAEAMVIFGQEIGSGIATILVVIMFLFVVPCVTKLMHIIRKFLLLSNRTDASVQVTSKLASHVMVHVCFSWRSHFVPLSVQTCKSTSSAMPTSLVAVTKSMRMKTKTTTYEFALSQTTLFSDFTLKLKPCRRQNKFSLRIASCGGGPSLTKIQNGSRVVVLSVCMRSIEAFRGKASGRTKQCNLRNRNGTFL